jgi:transcriptional repressor of cell division inhibition gene dicB
MRAAMHKTEVLEFFGGNQSAVARALHIARASVNDWPELIPERSAYRLERITEGKLKVRVRLYDMRRQRRTEPKLFST